jgi:hypothetical protein
MFEERIKVMRRHFQLMMEVFGEEHGCRMFRKVAPWYAKRFGPAKMFNKRVVTISTAQEFHQVLQDYQEWRQQFLDDAGNLHSKYAPPPMTPSFMEEDDPDEPAVARRKAIPVPKGPVENW